MTNDLSNTRALSVHLSQKLDSCECPTFRQIHTWIREFVLMSTAEVEAIPELYIVPFAVKRWIEEGDG